MLCFVVFLRVWCSRLLAVSLYRWWQYLFKLGANIPTCRFLGKATTTRRNIKAKAGFREKSKIIQTSFSFRWKGERGVWLKEEVKQKLLEGFAGVVKDNRKIVSAFYGSENYGWAASAVFSKTPKVSFFFGRVWVISPPLQSVLAIAPLISRTIHLLRYLQYCLPLWKPCFLFFFQENVRVSDYLRLFGTLPLLLPRQIIHIWQEN